MATKQMADHPVWKEIQGYNTSDPMQAMTSFMVYMELCEDKGWWNMKCHVCKELSRVFLSGHPSRNKPRELVYPVSVDDAFSPADLQHYLKIICLPDYQTQGLTLAVVAGDSSTVYYKISDGLVVPDTPDITEWKKYRREETPQLKNSHIREQTSQFITRQQRQQQQQQSEQVMQNLEQYQQQQQQLQQPEHQQLDNDDQVRFQQQKQQEIQNEEQNNGHDSPDNT